MKIGLRILFGYFAIVGLAAYFLLNVFVEQVKPGVRATLEDTLVDTANVLALMVEDDVRRGAGQAALLARIAALSNQPVGARIGGVPHDRFNYRVYITDQRGIVTFDTAGRAVGQDYSRWNNVYLTLRGQYGARSTRETPDDDASTVMHVSAPLHDGTRISGVLTVAKPISTVQPFVQRSQMKILRRGALLLALSLLIGIGFAIWLTRGLRKLTVYAAQVQAGQKATLPRLGDDEIGALGRALDSMRHQLEGKQYAEELMHTLAHELKSPIAAIQASAELLREEMPETERRRFLSNIEEQNARQRQLIDRLLALVRVEQQQRLAVREPVPLATLLAQATADARPKADARAIALDTEAGDLTVPGDPLLLRQALGNLVDNALDFAPRGGRVRIGARRAGPDVLIEVCDDGPGVPDYALARVFERFYSLARPDGAKSTGLGLAFVREVALLHGGTASLANRPDGGACAQLRLPLH